MRSIYSHFRAFLLVLSLPISAHLPAQVAPPCSATVTAPSNQTYCAGSTTVLIAFTGTGQVYRWTNSNPAIGLPASGTGTIDSFTALNATNSSQTATITVTPERPTLAYVSSQGSNNVSVIDVATQTIVTSIGVGIRPEGLSVSPDGNLVYVANTLSNDVSVIDVATNTVTATIGVGFFPFGVGVSPNGSRVYVVNNNSYTVSVIDAATHTVTATIDVGDGPEGISLSPDGSRVYVINHYSDNMSVIDAATNTVSSTIAVGSLPLGHINFIGPGCEGTPQSFTLTVEPAPMVSIHLTTAPAATQPILPNTPGVTLTVTGCSGGTVSWQGASGTSGSSGSSTIIPVSTANPGDLVYSATCTRGSCVSEPGSVTVTIAPALVSGSFDGFVNGADCGSFRGWAWDRGKGNTPVSVEILDGPAVISTLLAGDFRQDLLDAGKGNGKHAFRFMIPESIKDGLPHNLSARVAGSSFILKDSPKALICAGTAPVGNQPPQPPNPTVLNAPLSAQVNVPFSGTLVAFTDPEGTALTYGLNDLPAGLSLNPQTRVISGTPTVAGSFVLTYTATDAGGANNSVSFVLTVNPAGSTTVTGSFEGYLDKLDCGGIRGWVWDRNKSNTPLTVEFYLDESGTVLGSAVANIYRVDLKDAGKGNGAHAYNFTPPGSITNGTKVRARVLGSTYELKGSPKVYQCAPARLSAENGSELQVTVLGNPVSHQVNVEIWGVEGHPLRLQLTDLSGRLVSQRQIEVAKPVERLTLSAQQQPAGLLFLKVTSGLKTVTLKVIKQ